MVQNNIAAIKFTRSVKPSPYSIKNVQLVKTWKDWAISKIHIEFHNKQMVAVQILYGHVHCTPYHRVACPIHNSTLWTYISNLIRKTSSIFCLNKCLRKWQFSFFLRHKSLVVKPQLKIINFSNRKIRKSRRFKGFCCISVMLISNLRVTWNFIESLQNIQKMQQKKLNSYF